MVVLLGCKRMLQVTFRGEMEGKVLKTPLAIFAFSQLHVKELYIDGRCRGNNKAGTSALII